MPRLKKLIAINRSIKIINRQLIAINREPRKHGKLKWKYDKNVCFKSTKHHLKFYYALSLKILLCIVKSQHLKKKFKHCEISNSSVPMTTTVKYQ